MRRRREVRQRRRCCILAYVLCVCFLLILLQPAALLSFWGTGAGSQVPTSSPPAPAASSPPPYVPSENKATHAVVTATRVKISTDEEFDREALGLVKLQLKRQRQRQSMQPEAGKHVRCGEVLRCALLSPLALKACSMAFREVYDKVTEQGGDAPVTLLFSSSTKCQGDTASDLRARDFLEGSNRSIMNRLSSQISRMQKTAEASGLRFPSLQTLYEGVLEADAGRGDNTPSNVYGGRAHVFGGAFSAVQVLSVRYLLQGGLASFPSLEEGLATVLGAATTTYVLMSPPSSTLRAMALTEPLRQAAAKENCAFTQLPTDNMYLWKDGSPLSALVIGIHCPKGYGPGEGQTLRDSSPGQRLDMKGEVTQPLLCEHLPGRVLLARSIKYGSRTAIFHGKWRKQKVIVKLFHPYQYFSFQGFRDFMQERSRRSPLIHYPAFSCYSSKYNGIFQVQPVLGGHVTLQSLLSPWGARKRVSLRQRLEIAVQIVCIFEFLHAGHPAGFFLYDDNHPGQYLLKKEGDDFYAVRLIDIDTLQKGTAAPLATPRYPYSNVSSHCRCFYCRGRSNCMFFNTNEAYEACGQLQSREAWVAEMPLLVRPGRLCDGSSDMWFEAQLLFFLFDGTVAWRALSRDALLHQIKSGRVPRLTNSSGAAQHSEAMRQLLSRMFLSRPTETAVLRELRALCTAVGGCSRLAACPATAPVSAGGRYSSPLNLRLSR
ncbi:transferase [Trypanosoma conorhini]|uniref:Transferase n=1 Tax=Trypanosoma conorhini TaxID=83891 RepID=A0A422Q945_9TRYP|nr:transferase [Trypanosoma conorhini]RNF26491.1 transferase [Trypanosoma conorhini]